MTALEDTSVVVFSEWYVQAERQSTSLTSCKFMLAERVDTFRF